MILWYRFLDSLQSKWNRYWKIRAGRKRWGKDADLNSLTRSGRRYSRVISVQSWNSADPFARIVYVNFARSQAGSGLARTVKLIP